ncbi:MAG: GNAT family N-acetyltransferase [Rhodothermales bacterium]
MRRPAGEIQVRQDAASGHVSIVKVDLTSLKVIKDLNTTIFREDRIINTFDREDLMILLALVDNVPAGFKIGYRENRFTYYSAKGGVLPEYRRQGLARKMLYFMMAEARVRGYIRFAFDTFPNRDRGMTVLGLNEGFRVVKSDFNKTYKDWRLRFEKALGESG